MAGLRKYDYESVIRRACRVSPGCADLTSMARKLDIPRKSLGEIVQSVVDRGEDETLFQAFQRYVAAIDIDVEQISDEYELQHYKRRVKALEQILAGEESWHNTLLEVAAMLRSVPVPVPSPPKIGEEKSRHIALLNVTDVHFGAEEVGLGLLPWYDMKIAKAAIAALFQRTILLLKRLDYIEWDAIIVHFLGDLVEQAYLREGHPRRVGAGVAEQVVECAYLFAKQIRMLAGEFTQVYVTGVPGNHGRITKKPGVAAPWDNFDWLTYKLLEALLSNQPNVTCLFPKCWYMFHVLYGEHVVYSMHGEDIRSYVGFPWYGYGRAIADIVGMRTLEAKETLRSLDFEGEIRSLEDLMSIMLVPDTVVIGHQHQEALFKLFSTNAIAAMSMIPVTEFSAKRLRKMGQSSQTLCIFSETRKRLVTTYSIWLDDVIRDMSKGQAVESPVMRIG